MISKQFDWKNTSEVIENQQLNLFVSANNLVFFSKNESKDLILLTDFITNSVENWYNLEFEPDEIDTINQFISEKSISKIFVSNVPYSLVPSNLFNKDSIENYLTTSRKINSNFTPKYQFIEDLNLYLVYDAPSKTNLITELSNLEETHWLTSFLPYLQKNSIEDCNIYAVIVNRTLSIIVFQQEKLLFVNDFEIKDSIDALYFILLVYQELHQNPSNIPLSLIGQISEDSEIVNHLKRYIATVKIENHLYDTNPELSFYSYLLNL